MFLMEDLFCKTSSAQASMIEYFEPDVSKMGPN